MIDYEYLGWGVDVPQKEKFKTLEYSELEKMHTHDYGEISFDEGAAETDSYNMWFLNPLEDNAWGDESTHAHRRLALEKEIRELARKIVPGHPLWEWNGGTFCDMFLLDETFRGSIKTEYDSVLLLQPDVAGQPPVAIIWEMVPDAKRGVLLNLQLAGKKLYAGFSDNFPITEDGFVCLEVYIK